MQPQRKKRKFGALLSIIIIFGVTSFSYAPGDQTPSEIQLLDGEDRPPRYPSNWPEDTSSLIPVPLPEHTDAPTASNSDASQVISYDLATGVESISTVNQDIFPDQMEAPGNGPPAEEFSTQDFSTLSLVSNTTTWPARAAVRIAFTSGGLGYTCSGTLIDATHVLTAAHCVYYDGAWSTNVSVAPAYNNGTLPYGDANSVQLHTWVAWTNSVPGNPGDVPDWNFDIGLIDLDRPVGSLTSWLGYGWTDDCDYFKNGTWTHNGYPGETPYNSELMYTQSGTYNSCQEESGTWTGEMLTYNLSTFEGQSGSGSMRDQMVRAVVSSKSISESYDVRINSGKFGTIGGWIAADYPSSYDLVPLDVNTSSGTITAGQTLSSMDFLVFNNSTAAWSGTTNFSVYLSTNNIISTFDTLLYDSSFTWSFTAKGTVRLTAPSPTIPIATPGQGYFIGIIIDAADSNTSNNTAEGQDASAITVNVPLRTISLTISGSGSGTVTSVPGGINCSSNCVGFYSYGDSVTLTASANAGSTFTGWSGSGCSGTSTCTVSMTVNRSIAANFNTISVDSYEPDGSSGQANWITSGSQQNHSISPVGDEDWVKFTISDMSQVVVETSGPSGDTRMWLYESDGTTQVEYNDDGGAGNFSKIDRMCGVDTLSAGTYYVKIDDYGDNSIITSYDIDLTVTACPDSYEPDDSSGQANSIYSSNQQTHSILPVGDEDWVKITLNASTQVVLETSGPSGDTRMWLYESDGTTQVEYNDNSGTGNFSKIDRMCGVDPLSAGTYYVKIDDYGDNSIIASYNIDMATAYCVDSYEPDGSSGQAKWLYTGIQQTRSILPVGDQDWVIFNVNSLAQVILETSASVYGDTHMWLYESDGTTQVEFNDDIDAGGGNYFSKIDRMCGVDALAAGIYYVKISEDNNNIPILSYNFDLTITACGGGGNEPVPPADFDGDGDTDVSVFRPSNGRWYTSTAGLLGAFGTTGDIPVPQDYDGDGDSDIVVYRPSNGRWYFYGGGNFGFGVAGDIPMPCDYDGDGDADIAIYRPSNGRWYVKDQGYTAYGIAGDIPVPGDYDGDGDCDVAIYRPSNGRWYVQGQGYAAWGITGDIPVPGDYDGDGDFDFAIYRPSNGRWYVLGQGYVAYGIAGDIPVPGDYDGDGSWDQTIYRPSNGRWYMYGIGYEAFGIAGDYPLPARDTNIDGDPHN